LIAIKDAGSTKKEAGAKHNEGKTAIKDSLIAIKESLIVRRRSGEIVVLGRFLVCMVVSRTKRLIRAIIIERIAMSRELSEIMELSLGISAALAAIEW
jgi:hypothetical protein